MYRRTSSDNASQRSEPTVWCALRVVLLLSWLLMRNVSSFDGGYLQLSGEGIALRR
jgi:hypothetical protein